VIHRDIVDGVLRESGKREQRSQVLPAHTAVYYTLALNLYFGEAYEEVMRQLALGLRFLGIGVSRAARPGCCSNTTPTSPARVPQLRRQIRWMNGYGKLRRCTERDGKIVDFYLYLAAALLTVRRLIQRARTLYRWDTRPTRPTPEVTLFPDALSSVFIGQWWSFTGQRPLVNLRGAATVDRGRIAPRVHLRLSHIEMSDMLRTAPILSFGASKIQTGADQHADTEQHHHYSRPYQEQGIVGHRPHGRNSYHDYYDKHGRGDHLYESTPSSSIVSKYVREETAHW
jgi:hypothetical protein